MRSCFAFVQKKEVGARVVCIPIGKVGQSWRFVELEQEDRGDCLGAGAKVDMWALVLGQEL